MKMLLLSLALCLQCFAPTPLFFAQNQAPISTTFTPSSVSGLWAWFQPNLEGLSNGASIATLTDWSGNGHTASQGTASAKPTYDSTSFAFGCATWDGVNDTMAVSGAQSFGDFYVLLVVRMASFLPAAGRIVDKAYDTGFWLGTDYPGGNNMGGGVRESSPNYGIYVAASTGTWYAFQSYRTGTSHFVILNGTSNNNTVGSTATSTAAFELGSVSGANFTSFKMAALLIYDNFPSSGDRTQLLQWAADNFGTPP